MDFFGHQDAARRATKRLVLLYVLAVLVMFVLGLSMYGMFEIGASATSVGGSLQSKQGLSGSFFSGILATVGQTFHGLGIIISVRKDRTGARRLTWAGASR